MMDPILPEFEELVASVHLAAPAIPFMATLRGEWADGSVRDPSYWSAQLRETVRFADGLRALAADGRVGDEAVLVEAGPGRTLSTFAAETARETGQAQLCADVAACPGRAAHGHRAPPWMDSAVCGRAEWRSTGGGSIARNGDAGSALPTYPFERRSYWIGPSPDAAADQTIRDTAEWFFRPEWREAPPPAGDGTTLAGNRVLVFDEGTGVGAAVVAGLRAAGALPLVVTRGDRVRRRRRRLRRSIRPTPTPSRDWPPRSADRSRGSRASSTAGTPHRPAEPISTTRRSWGSLRRCGSRTR